jgi:uncharacterized membrane protein
MQYIFLIINFILLLVPFLLCLDQKHFNVTQIKSTVPAALIAAIIYATLSVFFVLFKVWIFDHTQLVGISYRALPLEQYLFCFAFSFAGLNIYTYLNQKFPANHLQKYSLALSNLFLGLGIAMLFFNYTKWYTVITFSVLMILLLFVEYINSLRFMYRFYRAFLICLLLSFSCYGIICSEQIISYNQSAYTQLSLFNVPFENHFFVMGMMLLAVYVYTYFNHKKSLI